MNTRPEADCDHSCLTVDNATPKVHNGIGDLGMRRGFKGTPLIFSPTRDSLWSGSSPFLRGFNFSPSSLDIPYSPRSPLVASRMRSVSESVISWSPSLNSPVPTLNEVEQDLQDLYDHNDPFASSADTFFVVSTDPAEVSAADACDFAPYRRRGMITRQPSCMGKKKIMLHEAFTNARMRTTIYNMSMADVIPAPMVIPIARAVDVAALTLDQADVDVTTTSLTIVLTGPSTPPTQERTDEDKMQFGDNFNFLVPTEIVADTSRPKNLEPSRVEHTTPRSAFEDIHNPGSSTGQVLREVNRINGLAIQLCDAFPSPEWQALKYAEFPATVHESGCGSSTDHSLTLFPGDDDALPPCPTTPVQRRSSLRPLVLPARVASRLSARIGPVPQDDDAERRSEALEGIIALLDKAFATP
ncbi:hypothetical protein C0991_011027 [Blastosporella zonata]|nr:hypothetical protein C0991_011027 [Blastosporella zonata]